MTRSKNTTSYAKTIGNEKITNIKQHHQTRNVTGIKNTLIENTTKNNKRQTINDKIRKIVDNDNKIRETKIWKREQY